MSDPSTIILRSLTTADLFKVTSVHSASFPESTLTLLGKEAVRRYYEWQLLGPHDCSVTGAFCGEEMVGFCVGGSFQGAMSGFIRKNGLLLGSLAVLKFPAIVIRNPLRHMKNALYYFQIISAKLSDKIKTAKVKKDLTSQGFGILAIAVHPDYRRKNVGKMLMDFCEHMAREKGFKRMNLTVNPKNRGAIAFYTRQGWQEYSEGAMEKILN